MDEKKRKEKQAKQRAEQEDIHREKQIQEEIEREKKINEIKKKESQDKVEGLGKTQFSPVVNKTKLKEDFNT